MRQNLINCQNGANGENASLLLNKYLTTPAGEDQDSSARIKLMEQAQNSLDAVRDFYPDLYLRWEKTIQNNNVVSRDFKTDGNTIIGLGSDNVLETGITLHHTYGIPYIPGSALKGLASHYCNDVFGLADRKFKNLKIELEKPDTPKETKKKLTEELKTNYHHQIFGSTISAGYIKFFDAWLLPQTLSNCLQPDVMTPHHSKYYGAPKNDNQTPPSDFDSPIPIHFLSVVGSFKIAVGCDDPSDKGKKWAQLALNILIKALAESGIGGKTSSGYGRLIIE